ncbi:hypothetical protein NEOLEDRAFT_1069849, partial [Neolentinus lepideus HHB14362 ss-1]
LAYVEWFLSFPSRPNQTNGMYKVTRSIQNGERLASIVAVSQICHSVHLFPKFSPVIPWEWSSSTVLNDALVFFLNPFLDQHTFILLA